MDWTKTGWSKTGWTKINWTENGSTRNRTPSNAEITFSLGKVQLFSTSMGISMMKKIQFAENLLKKHSKFNMKDCYCDNDVNIYSFDCYFSKYIIKYIEKINYIKIH